MFTLRASRRGQLEIGGLGRHADGRRKGWMVGQSSSMIAAWSLGGCRALQKLFWEVFGESGRDLGCLGQALEHLNCVFVVSLEVLESIGSVFGRT